MSAGDRPEVTEDADHHRFVWRANGMVAELVYRCRGDRMFLLHTEVPVALRRQGIGGRMVRAAAVRAGLEQLTLVPSCPFARAWLEAHGAEFPGLSVDWVAGGGA